MTQKTIRKNYLPSGGVDLKSNDIVRDENHLSGGQNVRYGDNYGFRKRFGFHKKASNTPRLGTVSERGPEELLFTHSFIDRFNVKKEELIAFRDSTVPYRYVEGHFTITNGTGSDVTLSFYYSEIAGEFVFDVDPIGSVDAGVGDVGDDSIDDLVSSLNALAGITCAVDAAHTSESGEVYAACSEIIADETLSDGNSRDVKFWYWEEINRSANAGASVSNSMNVEDYIKPSAVTLRNVLYCSSQQVGASSSSINRLTKYDGQTFYRVGVPEAPKIYCYTANYQNISPSPPMTGPEGTIAYTPGTSSRTVNDYRHYRVRFICHDNAGNIVKGRPSPKAEVFTTALTGPGVLGIAAYLGDDAASVRGLTTETYEERKADVKAGFYDHCGLSTSNQSSVLTINLQAGLLSPGNHTLAAGDVVRFYDTSQAKFIWRKVLSTTSGSITIDSDAIDELEDSGGTVSVNVYAVFSTMTAEIYKSIVNSPDAPLYFLDEVPVNVFDTIQNGFETSYEAATNIFFYVDKSSDISSTGALQFPQYVPGPGPECAMVASYNGILVTAGNPRDRTLVSFEDIVNLESFPESTHSFQGKNPVSGIGQTGAAFAVFGEDNVQVVYGDLSLFNFRVETVAENIGCLSHNTIQEIDEGIITFLSKRGVYILSGGRNLVPLGAFKDGKTSILEPYFTREKAYRRDAVRQIDGVPIVYPNFYGALAAVDNIRKVYYLHIPFPEDGTDSFKRNLGSVDSETWAYDYGIGAWLPVMTGLDFSQGIVYHKGDIWGMNHDYQSSFLRYGNLFKQISDKGIYNYGDHAEPIDASVRSHHESLGDPNLYKKYLRAAVAAFGECDSSQWVLELLTYPNYDYNTVMTDAIGTGRLGDITRFKLKSGKANALMVELRNANRYEDFLITGWDLSLVTPYGKPSSAFRGDD